MSLEAKRKDFFRDVLRKNLSKFDRWLVYSFNLNPIAMWYIRKKYGLKCVYRTDDVFWFGIEINGVITSVRFDNIFFDNL